MFHFCLDIGGTKTVGALFAPDGTEIARAHTGPGAISLGAAVTAEAIATLWTALRPHVGVAETSLTAGLAGVGLRDRLAELDAGLGTFFPRRYVNDGYGMLLDITRGAAGAVITIGTGVSALRLMEDGGLRTLSGWGFPAGDLGSGAWIGLQAVTALHRAIDRSEGSPPMGPALFNALMQALGGTPASIMEETAPGRAHVFARLAPLVLKAEGDPVAKDILGRAAREIAFAAQALWDGATDASVTLTGGLAAPLSPHIRARAPDFDWHLAQPDPIAGLALLARGLAPEERLLPRPAVHLRDY